MECYVTSLHIQYINSQIGCTLTNYNIKMLFLIITFYGQELDTIFLIQLFYLYFCISIFT